MEPLSRITDATIDVLVHLLGESDATWGLLIVKATNRPTGTVYPVLERLERAGWVESEWDDSADRPGPRRRLYRLTGDGVGAARSAVATHAARREPAPRVATGIATSMTTARA